MCRTMPARARPAGAPFPMHPEVYAALVTLQTWRSDAAGPDRPVIFSERGGGLSPATVCLWFHRLYTSLKMGFQAFLNSCRARHDPENAWNPTMPENEAKRCFMRSSSYWSNKTLQRLLPCARSRGGRALPGVAHTVWCVTGRQRGRVPGLRRSGRRHRARRVSPDAIPRR